MFNNKFTTKDPVAEEIEKIISERWDDDEDDDVAKADRELARMKAKPIKADTKTDPDKEMSKLAKRTPKEVDEELKGSQHKLDVAEPKGKLTGADFKKLRKEDAEQIDELSKNTLGSYVKKSSDAADKHLKLANSAAQRSKTKADTKQFLKHSEKFGKRTAGIKMATDRLNKEEAEQIDEISRDLATRYLNKAKGSMPLSDLSGKRKAGATLALKKKWGDKNFGIDEPKVKATEEFEHVKEAKGPTSTYGLDTFAKEANEPVTPLSRAKELARAAMSRIKNEMLGKAGATSEEIDPTIKSTDTLKGRIKGGKDDDVGPSATGRSTKVKYTPGPK